MNIRLLLPLVIPVLLVGCGQPPIMTKAQAQSEAHNILSGLTYASEQAGQEILLEELARHARQGTPPEGLLKACAARQKLTWDPDWLVFQVAAKADFLRPGFSLQGNQRMQSLGPLAQAAGDSQELAVACMGNASDEVSIPLNEFFRSYDFYSLPGPLTLYLFAYFNRDLATESAWARAIAKPINFFGASLSAEGFLRMRPHGEENASPLQKASLAALQTAQPESAALLYVGWPQSHGLDKDIPWNTESLKKGLAQLESRYPNSTWIKTREVEFLGDQESRRKLGHRWERTPAPAPPPELTQCWSELPACQVGPEKDSMKAAPQSGENLRIQVTDLLLRGQFLTLEALFAELQKNRDPRLELAYWGCLGRTDNRARCTVALDEWITAAPDSPVAPAITALMAMSSPLNRRWIHPPPARVTKAKNLARRAASLGNFDPTTVATLVAVDLAEGNSWDKQLKLVGRSLQADFLLDRSLETLVDLAPELKDPKLLLKFADQLKSSLGSDLGYCRVFGRALESRGLQPSQVDWPRFVTSLKALKTRADFTPPWALDLLFTLSRQGRRQEAAWLAPLCQSQDYLPPDRHPRVHKLVLAWAAGQGPSLWDPPTIRLGRSHSHSVKKGTVEGLTVNAEEKTEFGFEVIMDRPIVTNQLWKVVVTHPLLQAPEGPHSTCQRPYLVTPDDPSSVFVSYALRHRDVVKPGSYTLRLEDTASGKVLGERTFQLKGQDVKLE